MFDCRGLYNHKDLHNLAMKRPRWSRWSFWARHCTVGKRFATSYQQSVFKEIYMFAGPAKPSCFWQEEDPPIYLSIYLSNLILSYLIVSYLILSYPILSYLILSYLILSYLSIYLSTYLSIYSCTDIWYSMFCSSSIHQLSEYVLFVHMIWRGIADSVSPGALVKDPGTGFTTLATIDICTQQLRDQWVQTIAMSSQLSVKIAGQYLRCNNSSESSDSALTLSGSLQYAAVSKKLRSFFGWKFRLTAFPPTSLNWWIFRKWQVLVYAYACLFPL